jgi:methylenetetrahydrofolate reductase (NADPH)
MKVTNHIEDSKGETLFSFEIIPYKRRSIQDLYDNIDPLMEFKPPLCGVTALREKSLFMRKWFTR